MVLSLDHIVLTVRDIHTTCRFYSEVLGMTVIEFGKGRIALQFGNSKINLHQEGSEIEPHARQPSPGSADICLLISVTLEEAIERLEAAKIEIISGPVVRTGARGSLSSVYFRDPDGNLIEISRYLQIEDPS